MARGDQHSYKGDSRDAGKTSVEGKVESRASTGHPDRNEDAALGDLVRLREEAAAPPKMETRDSAADAEAVRQARERELKVAEKLKDKQVFGVLDGISGGREGGGTGVVASRLASARLSERMAAIPEGLTVDETKKYVLETMQMADNDVKQYRDAADAATSDPARKKELKQMGTTADIVKLMDNADGSKEAVIGHVGDSRVYLFDEKTKKLVSLTADENMVGYMLRIGQIGRQEYDQIMNTDDTDSLPDKLKGLGQGFGMNVRQMKNTLFNALGTGAVKEDNVFSVRVEKGQKLMITSDGVHDNLTDAQLEQLLAEGKSIEDITRLAAESGRKPDDVSAALIEIKGGRAEKGPGGSKDEAAAQAAAWEREIEDAQIEIALLADLKQKAASGPNLAPGKRLNPWEQPAFDIKEIQKIAELGGAQGIDRRIRQLKLESLPKEYQLAQQSLADLLREAGLAAEQVQDQFILQQQAAEWQRNLIAAAQYSLPGRKGAGFQGDVSMQSLDAVANAMRGGMSPEKIIKDATANKAEIDRKLGDLAKIRNEQERLQRIASEYQAADGERRAEIAAAERRQMDQARQNLAAAGRPQEMPAVQLPQEQQPQAPQTQQPKKKGLWGKVKGLFTKE